MRKIILFLAFLFSISSFSQLKGTVTDVKGNPIPFANIYVKDTYINTTSNAKGNYSLNLKSTVKFTILFQYLGYKTNKKEVSITSEIQTLDVVLEEEEIQLNEVVIKKGNNPAIEMIKNAIKNRKENGAKTGKYTADFYSRGIFRVKDLPKKILGQKLDMFDEIIDSTRSGILYLSETVSKIKFQKPDKLNETIIASKVSGNDNGFSFNSATNANYDFYDNYLNFDINAVSPIADNAFEYYKYKFDGSFTDENKQTINKIKVTPKRENDPAFTGYIYIVDDSWAIYAVDLSIKGSQILNPALNTLTLKQNFSYNSINRIWIKNTQTLDFEAGFFGININGKFTYGYSNFSFPEKFEKKTFTNEILKFEKDANKKDDDFWNANRPVPLTQEETTDYIKKDLLQTKKKSEKYLDSIDTKRNKFKFFDIITGYTYRNSFKKWSLNYSGLLNYDFNTVQGNTLSTGLSYTTRKTEDRTFTTIYSNFNYGFSEKKFRPTIGFYTRFNNQNYASLSANIGSSINQFNSNNPISNTVNAVSTLFFKDNYSKLYEKNFAAINFSQEVVNGLSMGANLEYSERKPLFNTTDYLFIQNRKKEYISNNPLDPNDFVNGAIVKHNLVKASLNATIKFGQTYMSRPNGKINLGNDKYPTVSIGFEKGFAGSDKKYEFDFVGARVTHDLKLGNKGVLNMNLKGGTFFNADNISFVDYKHFNGNQTHYSSADGYTNVFNLLPYYIASTNKSYIEFHSEYNEKGFLMNKIPLLNKLKSQLVFGFHNLSTSDRKPYQEFSVGLDNLGFGKFRVLRLDYVRSYQNGFVTDGLVFGLKLGL